MLYPSSGAMTSRSACLKHQQPDESGGLRLSGHHLSPALDLLDQLIARHPGRWHTVTLDCPLMYSFAPSATLLSTCRPNRERARALIQIKTARRVPA